MTDPTRDRTSPAPRRTTSWSGTAWPTGCPGCSATASSGWRVVHPDRSPTSPGRCSTRWPSARGRCRCPVPDGERAKTAAVGRGLLGGAGRGRLHPLRRRRHRRRRRDHRPRRLRRRHLAARGAGGARADHPARHGRRRGRRQDRHQHRPPARTSSARSTSRPACSATSTCCATLPRAELRRRARRGREVRLHRRPGDPRRWSRHRPAPRSTAGSPVLRELVERAIRVKVDVVVADLRETGGADGHPGREVLNYGHTLAHAIERAEEYGVRHGEAVAIGLRLRRRAGPAAPAALDDRRWSTRHRAAFARVGLPTTLRPGRLRRAARRDAGRQEGARLAAAVRRARPSSRRPTVLAGPREERPARRRTRR